MHRTPDYEVNRFCFESYALRNRSLPMIWIVLIFVYVRQKREDTEDRIGDINGGVRFTFLVA